MLYPREVYKSFDLKIQVKAELKYGLGFLHLLYYSNKV